MKRVSAHEIRVSVNFNFAFSGIQTYVNEKQNIQALCVWVQDFERGNLLALTVLRTVTFQHTAFFSATATRCKMSCSYCKPTLNQNDSIVRSVCFSISLHILSYQNTDSCTASFIKINFLPSTCESSDNLFLGLPTSHLL